MRIILDSEYIGLIWQEDTFVECSGEEKKVENSGEEVEDWWRILE